MKIQSRFEGADCSRQGPSSEPRDGSQSANLPKILQAQALDDVSPETVAPGALQNSGHGRRAVTPDNSGEWRNRGRDMEGGKMEALELAARKVLLPYIDKLSFIEIALAQVKPM